MTLRTRSPGRMAMILAAPALLVALTGCADGGAPGGSSSVPAAGSRQAWTLKYTQCLRDNGVDVQDPPPAEEGIGVNMNAWPAPEAVLNKCTEQLGTPPPLSKDEKAKIEKEQQKYLLKVANCYRDNGVNVPDPVPGEGLKIPSGAPQNVLDKCGGVMGALTPAGE
ncbi:hypothetical protein [Dactylosporangium sp. NPDC051484]|uniref:hypothetical protein n=1 Tax=Dactylosporangium sp. NPDC051484 TaxID=3154942 RepID=UPI00344CD36E